MLSTVSPGELALHPDLIRVRGYPAEVHHIITQDGYILEVHRIPHGRFLQQPIFANASSRTTSSETTRLLRVHPCEVWDRLGCDMKYLHSLHFRVDPLLWAKSILDNCTTSAADLGRYCEKRNIAGTSRRISRLETRPVVILQHGVLCSSADYVMNDPDQALGFILADLGYDVWLGNVRGNFYGRRHITLSPKQSKFWEFSWDKISQYDMPAMLSYIRMVTGAAQLDYVGHSMGTTIFFTMMNYHPNINSWIRKMAAMAPSAYIHNTFLGYRALAPVINFFNRLQLNDGSYKKYEQGNLSRKARSILSKLCAPYVLSQHICKTIINIIGGPSLHNSIDHDYLPVIVAHTPAGGGNNILAHYGQLVMARRYQAFDYGQMNNIAVYGTIEPPLFSLKAVTAPVGLFWSESDWVNSPPDVRLIAGELARVDIDHRIELHLFNHLDFLWSENANHYVYKPIIKYLNNSYS